MVGGPLTIGAVTFSLNWMLLGLVLAVVGLQAALTGLIARVIYDRTGRRRARILAALPYDRPVIGANAPFVAGVALAAPLTPDYLRTSLRSGESRGGKKCVSTCRARWPPDHFTKNKKQQKTN